MSEKLYADRDSISQGEVYVRHVQAMTAEGLHAKSDIAAELAHRDIEIERLVADVVTLHGICNEQAIENESLRAECGVRQIAGYNKGREQMAAELATLRAVIAEADKLRDAAVDLMQTHVIPDSRMSDDEFVERMYGIFDGPPQRAYDAARAAMRKALSEGE